MAKIAKWKQESEEVEKWAAKANPNTLMSFTHMAENIARRDKISIERARVHAYKRMKKKGMIGLV